TYLGGATVNGGGPGSPDDYAVGVAVIPSGDVIVAGSTVSSDFPVTAGALRTSPGGFGFVSRLHATGSALVYSSYFDQQISGVAAGPTGKAYLTGWLGGSLTTTPGAFQSSSGGGMYEASLSVLDPLGTTLTYSTYLGGAGEDVGTAVAVDDQGDAFV